jgi:HD superfamily phosphohydrolase
MPQDKFDYFMRDARQLGIASGFDPYRLMLFTRVMEIPAGHPSAAAHADDDDAAASPSSSAIEPAAAAGGAGAGGGQRQRRRLTLAFKESEAWNIYELFHARYTLHKRAYQHRTANCIEGMLCEVLATANEHITLSGARGKLPFLCRLDFLRSNLKLIICQDRLGTHAHLRKVKR